MNRLIYRRRRACFACGKLADTACAGHEYGGTINAWQVRPWAQMLGLPWVRQAGIIEAPTTTKDGS